MIAFFPIWKSSLQFWTVLYTPVDILVQKYSGLILSYIWGYLAWPAKIEWWFKSWIIGRIKCGTTFCTVPQIVDRLTKGPFCRFRMATRVFSLFVHSHRYMRPCSVHYEASRVLEVLFPLYGFESFPEWCRLSCYVKSVHVWWMPIPRYHLLCWNHPSILYLVAITRRQLDI